MELLKDALVAQLSTKRDTLKAKLAKLKKPKKKQTNVLALAKKELVRYQMKQIARVKAAKNIRSLRDYCDDYDVTYPQALRNRQDDEYSKYESHVHKLKSDIKKIAQALLTLSLVADTTVRQESSNYLRLLNVENEG